MSAKVVFTDGKAFSAVRERRRFDPQENESISPRIPPPILATPEVEVSILAALG